MRIKKVNDQERNLIHDAGFYMHQVAQKLKVSESTLFRWFRKPLTQAQKETIYRAVEELKSELEAQLRSQLEKKNHSVSE